jgi:hypothetical protein
MEQVATVSADDTNLPSGWERFEGKILDHWKCNKWKMIVCR